MTEQSPPDQLLTDLTEAQAKAVAHVDGPMLVLAAAGSGKTRVITRRVTYLMSRGIPGNSILSITFTNKAAGEMKQRIAASSPQKIRDWGRLDQPWPIVCTFHSLCLRILKHYAGRIGLPTNFSVYDSADQHKLVKEAFKALEIGTTQFTPATIHATISNAKNRLIDAKTYARDADKIYPITVARVYTKYQELLKANNALDFDDLLMRTVQMFKEHPDILSELQDRFRYILIDEYQDTNHAQYILAHALALKHRNICVVGDPDQSIYAWRGADVKNILDFENDYPDALIVPLEQNYRSTKTILALADRLISYNMRRKKKKLWTENAQGEPAEILLCHDEHHEAEAITHRLKQIHDKENISWNEMAVFYRMNALSRVMEDALRHANVPYQIARGTEFYGRKEIKDVMAYLRVIVNPNDEISLTRIINEPSRGISDNTVRHMQALAIAHSKSLSEVMDDPQSIPGVTPRAQKSLAQFVKLMDSFRKRMQSSTGVRPIMEDVINRSGLEEMYRKEDPDRENEVANIYELISAAKEYDLENPEGSLEDYLSRVSLVSDADRMEGAGGAVTLMTLHSAKGLEFPVVAIIGLEEGCLPHSHTREFPEQIEEERRLFFVGITRAQKRLILSKAQRRMIRGMTNDTMPSQFLAQLPKEYLTVEKPLHQQQFAELRFDIGQRVRHPAFGLGWVRDVSNSGRNTRVVVEFPRNGTKILIAEHAGLEPA